MTKIFISYRRSDVDWAAGRISDFMRNEFEDDQVFFDRQSIAPGADFVETIGDTIDNCRVVLAIIGPNWLKLLKKRRWNSVDYVRIEIAQALRRGVLVIPVIIDRTSMPNRRALPKEISSISQRNASNIRADSFHTDALSLTDSINSYLALANQEKRFYEQEIVKTDIGATRYDIDDERVPISISHNAEYWKTRADGKQLFKIKAWLKGDKKWLDRVFSVEYQLHETFKNPHRYSTDRANNFEIRTNSWGAFRLRARVNFNDQEPVLLTHEITLPR